MVLEKSSEARAWIVDTWGEEAERQLAYLEQLLREENSRQNLISASSLSEVWLRHFADSAQLLRFARGREGLWLDLGSGAGFPGLVIALLDSARHVRLVESRKRRATWLESAIGKLGLENCSIAPMAVEKLPSEPVAVISARAFAPLDKTLELAARFSTPDTLWILPKGSSAEHEVEMLQQRRRRMFHVEQSLTSQASGIILGRGIPS